MKFLVLTNLMATKLMANNLMANNLMANYGKPINDKHIKYGKRRYAQSYQSVIKNVNEKNVLDVIKIISKVKSASEVLQKAILPIQEQYSFDFNRLLWDWRNIFKMDENLQDLASDLIPISLTNQRNLNILSVYYSGKQTTALELSYSEQEIIELIAKYYCRVNFIHKIIFKTKS